MSAAADRVRTLLLRGDNVLKKADTSERLARAMAAFEEAREVAQDPDVDPRVRELVQRRIDSLRGIMEASG